MVLTDLVLGGFVVLKVMFLKLLEFSELLIFSLLQDLQHIWRNPAFEQYRVRASIWQNTERSARHCCPGDRWIIQQLKFSCRDIKKFNLLFHVSQITLSETLRRNRQEEIVKGKKRNTIWAWGDSRNTLARLTGGNLWNREVCVGPGQPLNNGIFVVACRVRQKWGSSSFQSSHKMTNSSADTYLYKAGPGRCVLWLVWARCSCRMKFQAWNT